MTAIKTVKIKSDRDEIGIPREFMRRLNIKHGQVLRCETRGNSIIYTIISLDPAPKPKNEHSPNMPADII